MSLNRIPVLSATLFQVMKIVCPAIFEEDCTAEKEIEKLKQKTIAKPTKKLLKRLWVL